MIANFKNVLVLAPHTDDGELGAGGTIAKLIENNANVYYAAFSTAEDSVGPDFDSKILTREVRAATTELGIPKENLIIFNYKVRQICYHRQEVLEDLIKIRKSMDIDLVLMPALTDIHQDHSTVANEGLRAFKHSTILGYELIWNNLSFNTTSFVKLNSRHVAAKSQALQQYKSQAHRPYMRQEFIHSLAKTRGVQIGSDYAECFEVLRWVME